ncbi:hypothetical protein TNCV_235931, partial [Trichonephila clavipes]
GPDGKDIEIRITFRFLLPGVYFSVKKNEILRNQYPEQPPLAVITALICPGIESEIGGHVQVQMPMQLQHDATAHQRFVVDHAIEDTSVCDAASIVVAAIVSKLRVHAAANVIELFVQILVVLQLTPILDLGLMTLGPNSDLGHDPLKPCG